jgi:hypothetical protein
MPLWVNRQMEGDHSWGRTRRKIRSRVWRGSCQRFPNRFSPKLLKSECVPEGPSSESPAWDGGFRGWVHLWPAFPPSMPSLLSAHKHHEPACETSGCRVLASQDWLAGSERGNERGCLSAPLSGVRPASGHSSILPTICSCHQLLAPPP